MFICIMYLLTHSVGQIFLSSYFKIIFNYYTFSIIMIYYILGQKLKAERYSIRPNKIIIKKYNFFFIKCNKKRRKTDPNLWKRSIMKKKNIDW